MQRARQNDPYHRVSPDRPVAHCLGRVGDVGGEPVKTYPALAKAVAQGVSLEDLAAEFASKLAAVGGAPSRGGQK